MEMPDLELARQAFAVTSQMNRYEKFALAQTLILHLAYDMPLEDVSEFLIHFTLGVIESLKHQ